MRPLHLVGTDESLLTEQQAKEIEQAVITAVEKPWVGRAVMPRKDYGDYGVREVEHYVETNMSAASIAMDPTDENADTVGLTPVTTKIPVLFKNFRIYERQLETSKRYGTPLDTSFASGAGRKLGQLEETLIWESALGYNGFMNVTGRLTEASAGAWSTAANAYTDIRDAVAELETAGYSGKPIAIVTPAQKADMRAHIGTTSDTVLEKASELATIVTAHYFADDASALVVMPDSENFDLIIAADPFTRAWVLPGGDLFYRVYEAVMPRFKRANSICEITGITV